MSPHGGGEPDGELAAAVKESFGSMANLKGQLNEAALTVQGSGWGTLAWEPLGKRLVVEQVYDHQGNIGNGTVPLLVLDMWEHAYYLQYENVKGDWVKAFWKLVNWEDVAPAPTEGSHPGSGALDKVEALRCYAFPITPDHRKLRFIGIGSMAGRSHGVCSNPATT